MTGRHHVRHGRAGRTASARLRVIAAAAAVSVVLAGSWVGYRILSIPACEHAEVRLTVAAAPELAPAVRAVTNIRTKTLRERCMAVTVAAADPADVAAAIAERHHATLDGVGRPIGAVQVPDVWIPDSSLWLQRVRGESGPMFNEQPSVARSRVVVAMPVPAARALGWPRSSLAWSTLLPRLAADSRLRTGIVEPHREAASLSALLALRAGTADDAAGRQATVKVLRALATDHSFLRDDLLARFPRSADPQTMVSALTAAPLSEQAVIAYNARRPPVPLAAIYAQPPAIALDYPYVVLPELSPQQQQAAQTLFRMLSGSAYRDRLAAVGLRAPDGSTGGEFVTPPGAPATEPPAAPAKSGAIDAALATWRAIASPGRMLTVIDVSASMLEPVPAVGGATREQVTVESAHRGLAMLDDSWAVGLWIFSTRLDGARDYRQLARIGPLSAQRAELQRVLSTVQPKRDGGTGLYDTVLAAYRAVQDGWDPSRVNSVVILTDGRNEDRRGGTLDQLVVNLRKAIDPARPIQVIALGIGDQVSREELKRITATTGGGTFLASDPSRIGEVFVQAIGLRTAGPH
jgi:Ca-activated chloride channel homolog